MIRTAKLYIFAFVTSFPLPYVRRKASRLLRIDLHLVISRVTALVLACANCATLVSARSRKRTRRFSRGRVRFAQRLTVVATAGRVGRTAPVLYAGLAWGWACLSLRPAGLPPSMPLAAGRLRVAVLAASSRRAGVSAVSIVELSCQTADCASWLATPARFLFLL